MQQTTTTFLPQKCIIAFNFKQQLNFTNFFNAAVDLQLYGQLRNLWLSAQC